MRNHLLDDRLVCTRPFEWFEIHPGGDVFACCPAWLKTPLGNLLTDSLQEIWNGPTARRIRTAILDGSFQYCRKSRCPKLANTRGPVRPLAEVKDGEVRDAMLRRETRLPYEPRRIHLCFDRSCTLACPSCRREVHVSTGEELARAESLACRVPQSAAEAEELRLSGTGDPFGSPVYLRMLQAFSPQDYPRLRRIHLHTNGQLWDEATWRTMPALHPFVRTAEISVDAARAETYGTVRPGGNFERLLRNLDFLQTLPVAATLSFVVQAANWREMPDFVALGRKRGFRVYFSRLVNWGTFSRTEYGGQSVHLPDHPEHPPFRALLSALATEPDVDLGNLAPLLANTRKED